MNGRVQRFLVRCPKCGGQTTKVHLREHGECRDCRRPPQGPSASQEERQARIIDSGWQAYATEEGHE